MEKRGVRRTLTLLIAGALVVATSGFAAGVVVGEVHHGGQVSKVYSSYATSATGTGANGVWTDVPGLSVTASIPGTWSHALLLVTFETTGTSGSETGCYGPSIGTRIAVDGVGVQDGFAPLDQYGGSWQRQAVVASGTHTVSVQLLGCGPGTQTFGKASIVVLASKS